MLATRVQGTRSPAWLQLLAHRDALGGKTARELWRADPARGSKLTVGCAELALDFAGKVLAPGGDLLVKVFQSRDFQPFVRQLRGLFRTVKVRKPPASRQRSPELYLLARTFNSG